ncbi:oxygen-dependent coproporphyrinogen oxidase [Tunicatimonas pelagia]|uniref:oxygen-dependent coproporphyrinogen oxidase n=1 Tax=Tunicatimonas pelagia TaxID=931531 RepID=UPI0026669120|nr:oxygen-dependent coproporphyrinogen oxidase [Tunicatimonas pelagia]WKN41583.1 oxygen-dependent coproporphyrinogen oxidase [Tunicatimonas pelagia]
MITKEKIAEWFKHLQNDICTTLEEADGSGQFIPDTWNRPGGGGGTSRVLNNGSVIEKGGVNFSAVHGETPAKILTALNLDSAEFYATGVSIVLHPHNPFVPIIHMNVRYFEMSNGVYWFGGGIDLTPHYVDRADAQYFHATLKEVCDRFDPSYYPTYKKWADDYFYIKHRQETRGIGGIFFDRLTAQKGKQKTDIFAFVQAVGQVFAPTYTYFMNKNKDLSFEDQHKQWQYLRRGRYVEFNLVLDKGTKFGLDTDGRTESILMSLPPLATWQYNHTPPSDSTEAKTLSHLKKDINWIDF